MAITPIPKALCAFAANWVTEFGYDPVKLREAIDSYCTEHDITYPGSLSDAKLTVAIARGFVSRERNKDPSVTTDILTESLKKLGLAVSQSMVRHYVDDMIASGEIPQNPSVAEERLRSAIKETLESVVSLYLRTRQPIRKSIQSFTRHANKRLRKELGNDDIAITEDQVRDAFDAVFWTKEHVKAMEEFRRSGLPFETYLNLPGSGGESVPEWVIHEKWKDVKGRTKRPNGKLDVGPGIWNIRSAFTHKGDYTIPESSPEEGGWLVIPEGHNRPVHTMATLIAPHFGILYDPNIVNNLLRMAAADLEARGVDSVLVAGKLFYISTNASAGVYKVRKDMYSGLTLDKDAFTKLYQKRVEEIMEGLHDGELIYMTADERLEHLLTGMWEVWIKPNEKPEFSGKIYVVLGPAEEEIADAIATARQRYEVRRLIPRIDAEHKAAVLLLTKLKNDLDDLMDEVGDDTDPDVKDLKKKIEAAEQHIAELEDRHARTRQTLTHSVHARQDVPKILAWMAKKIEDAIPNSTVVGIGNAYLEWKNVGARVMVYQTDGNARAYDEFMKSHGHLDRTTGLPDVVITVNSRSRGATTLAVESIHGDVRTTSLVCEPPVMVDKKAVQQVRGTRRVNEPVLRSVFASDFVAGMQVFEFRKPDKEGQPRFPPTFSTITDEHVRYAAAKGDRSVYAPAYVSMLGATDPHFSSMNSVVAHTPNGEMFNLLESFLELTIRSGMTRDGRAPFHYMDVCDDWGQYLNFAVYTNMHPDRESGTVMSTALGEFQNQLDTLMQQPEVPRKEVGDLVSELRAWIAFQLLVRGEHTPSEQLDIIRDVLHRYRTVTLGILKSALRAGITVKSRTDVVGVNGKRARRGGERRKLGIINSGASNHFANTFDRNRPGLLFDSEIIRNELVALFTGDSALAPNNTKEELLKLITAPRSGASSVGMGVLYHGDTQVCPIEMRPSPIRRGPWHDPLRAQIPVDLGRADPAGFFTGPRRYRMFRTGDKHMFQVIVTGMAMYVMGAPGTYPDDFADVAGGIRPNSNGVTLTFVPATGITTGPTQTVLVPGYVLAYYLAHPEERFPLFDMMPKLVH